MKQFFLKTYLWLALLPSVLVFIGAASNQAVMIANGGKFPVQLNELVADGRTGMIDALHCVMTNETHLNALADIFNLRVAIESIGDLAIESGEFLRPFCYGAWLALVFRKLRGETSL